MSQGTGQQSPADQPALDAPLPYGPPLTLKQAKAILQAAEAEAERQHWPVAIVIADSSGDVVLALKRDQTQHSSLSIATGKALTAVNFRRPTKMFQDGIAAGGEGLRFLAVPGITPLEGGFPLVVGGQIVGGIGVSGVLSSQDAQVARAGMAALA
ncbi:MAG: heme-binding protein [Hylemonella sp.]|nr:heme-binding protein [Hylemonella sp.]